MKSVNSPPELDAYESIYININKNKTGASPLFKLVRFITVTHLCSESVFGRKGRLVSDELVEFYDVLVVEIKIVSVIRLNTVDTVAYDSHRNTRIEFIFKFVK